jgi:hypothetical protein
VPATGLALKSQPHVTSVRQWSRSVAIPRCQEPHSPDIELLWKDGEVVGERHLLDNRLGMAILKRLDRLAEREMYPCGGRGPVQTSTPAIRSHPFDWSLAVEALRTGDDKTVASALALVKGHEIDEIEDPSFFPGDGDEADDGIDLSHRFRSGYRDGERTWFTDFPPPAGFTG